MEWPIIIRQNKRPRLLRQSLLHRITFNIPNPRPDLVRSIQKHFPTALRPNWMFVGHNAALHDQRSRIILQIIDHRLSIVLVFTNHQVRMIRHDRTCVTGVLMFADRTTERLCDHRPLLSVEPNHGKPQQLFSGFIELANFASRRLHSLAPQVNFAQLGEHWSVNASRSTSARVVT